MIKRAFDVLTAFFGLLAFSPLLAAVMLGIWLQDRQSPFYIAPRAARGGGEFRMVKFRSMVANADKIGGSSTALGDRRITPIGHFVRAYKLDELIQLWNVLKGDMSLVGPRPQVPCDAALYTGAERRMLSVRPGITDPASIVFSDEGEILKGQRRSRSSLQPDHSSLEEPPCLGLHRSPEPCDRSMADRFDCACGVR